MNQALIETIIARIERLELIVLTAEQLSMETDSKDIYLKATDLVERMEKNRMRHGLRSYWSTTI